MPLDPQVLPLLEQAAGAPTQADQTPQQARETMESLTPALADPAAVKQVLEDSLPGAAGPLPVRVYVPEDRGNRAGIVFFHGGGWVVGSRDTHDALCRELARAAGSTVISVDYRLAPEHRFPAAAEDAYASACAAVAEAARFDIDPTQVVLVGDSAGANLATVAALMARDRSGPRFAAQLLLYPVTDCRFETASYIENATGYLLTRDSMIWFWRHYLGDMDLGGHPYASPLQAETLSGLPPALVMTAEFDPLRDEGEAYAEKLRRDGVPTVFFRVDGQVHGFLRRLRALDRARSCVSEVGAALRKMIG